MQEVSEVKDVVKQTSRNHLQFVLFCILMLLALIGTAALVFSVFIALFMLLFSRQYFGYMLVAIIVEIVMISLPIIQRIMAANRRKEEISNLSQEIGFKLVPELALGFPNSVEMIFDDNARKIIFVNFDSKKYAVRDFSYLRSYAARSRIQGRFAQSRECVFDLTVNDPINPMLRLTVSQDQSDLWESRLEALYSR